jgi:hypothetical protein
MAKRKGGKKTARRRTSKGISLLNVAETYALMNVATQGLFRTNPVQFLTGAPISGSYNITLRELLNQAGRFYDMPDTAQTEGATFYIMRNARQNAPQLIGGMILVPLAFKLAKGVGRPVISRTNALLKKAGVASTVKV